VTQVKSSQLSEKFKSAGGLNIESKEYKVSHKPQTQSTLPNSNATDESIQALPKTASHGQIELNAESSSALGTS